jgi:hypothetical protein
MNENDVKLRCAGLPFSPPIYASILILCSLAGCSRFPWSTSTASDEHLINELLYGSPSPPDNRAGNRHDWLSRNDKQITPEPRQISSGTSPSQSLPGLQRCLFARGIPQETLQSADPSNFDRRGRVDAEGRPVAHTPMLIVLHETVASEAETLNLFRTPHPDASSQASYHMLIPADGRRVRVVADVDRAFGAGNSAFDGFTIQLKSGIPGSINNIALHLSFVSPPDGREDAPTHSGYTPLQYRSAAAQTLLWQLSYGIPLERLTTHRAVDQSQTRTDPRSFDWSQFHSVHRQLAVSCGVQALAALP